VRPGDSVIVVVDQSAAVRQRAVLRRAPRSNARSVCSSRRGDSRPATRRPFGITPPSSPSAARCSGYASSP
jgi:hypothetical protein